MEELVSLKKLIGPPSRLTMKRNECPLKIDHESRGVGVSPDEAGWTCRRA